MVWYIYFTHPRRAQGTGTGLENRKLVFVLFGMNSQPG